jgi:hypothetical protein
VVYGVKVSTSDSSNRTGIKNQRAYLFSVHIDLVCGEFSYPFLFRNEQVLHPEGTRKCVEIEESCDLADER